MDLQAISSCACHGRICTQCDNKVAVLQTLGPRPRGRNERCPVRDSLCQDCVKRFAGKIIQYAMTKPQVTLSMLKERQGIRS